MIPTAERIQTVVCRLVVKKANREKKAIWASRAFPVKREKPEKRVSRVQRAIPAKKANPVHPEKTVQTA